MRRATLLLLLTLTACTTSRPLLTPLPYDTTFAPSTSILARDSAGHAYRGARAVVRDGYLVMFRADGTPDSLPRAEVVSLLVGESDGKGSFGIALGVVAALVLLGIALSGVLGAPIS